MNGFCTCVMCHYNGHLTLDTTTATTALHFMSKLQVGQVTRSATPLFGLPCPEVVVEKNKCATRPLFSEIESLEHTVKHTIDSGMALLRQDDQLKADELNAADCIRVDSLELAPGRLSSSPCLALKLRMVLARLLFGVSAQDCIDYPEPHLLLEVVTRLVDVGPFLSQLPDLKSQNSICSLSSRKSVLNGTPRCAPIHGSIHTYTLRWNPTKKWG